MAIGFFSPARDELDDRSGEQMWDLYLARKHRLKPPDEITSIVAKNLELSGSRANLGQKCRWSVNFPGPEEGGAGGFDSARADNRGAEIDFVRRNYGGDWGSRFPRRDWPGDLKLKTSARM